jgi:hypothetical protein
VFCLLPINTDFYVLLSNGNGNPLITYKSVVRLSYTFSGMKYIQKFGAACMTKKPTLLIVAV